MSDEDILRRVGRLEAKVDELLKIARRLWEKENAPPAPPKYRRTVDGGWEMWLGEGTGWGPCSPPKGPPAPKGQST